MKYKKNNGETKMKKFIVLFLSLCLLIAPLSACGKQSEGTNKIRLCEVTHSIFYAPLYVALEKGYFKEEGLEIELTNGGGADKVMTAILSNSADIGLMGPESAIYVYLEGKTDYPMVFGQLTCKDGSFLVSRKSEPNFKWEDLEGKGILAGRPGGVPAMTFEYVVNNHGLFDGTNIELIKNVQFDMMTAAFENGTGDYCTMFEPVASEFQKAGKGYIVASVGEGAGDVPFTSFIAKQSYISGKNDNIKKFLKALKKAYDFMNVSTTQNIAESIKGQFPAVIVDSLSTAVASYQSIVAWTTDMCMTSESFDRLQTIIENAGELSRRVDFSKIVNNSYAREIFG